MISVAVVHIGDKFHVKFEVSVKINSKSILQDMLSQVAYKYTGT
jgi:hypothetical protein